MSPLLEFRGNEAFRPAIRELLSNETMQRALLALRDNNLPHRLPPACDAIASVRLQSESVGYNQAIADLLSLGAPVPPPTEEPESTYEPDNA